MSILFTPISIKTMEIKNRFVRSATYDGYADEKGHATERQIEFFAQLARGGVGLIITGISYVHSSGQNSPVQNSIASDECIPGLRKLTDTVHSEGAKIAVQLFHAGRESAAFLKTKNVEALGSSFLAEDLYFKRPYRAMTEKEIFEVISAFGDSARRARDAGFDAVQVHGAHAYLLSQFLSPYSNCRTDQWGGPLENRLLLHREILKDIRVKTGEDYPILIKIGVQDGFPGGLEFNDGLSATQFLAQWGFDSLEVSSGLRGKRYEGTEFRTQLNRQGREAYFREACREVKRRVNVPVMMVGGLRSFGMMEEIITKGEADFVSMSRPFIREPFIINEWKKDHDRVPACISCNGCLEWIFKGNSLQCIQEMKKRVEGKKENG